MIIMKIPARLWMCCKVLMRLLGINFQIIRGLWQIGKLPRPCVSICQLNAVNPTLLKAAGLYAAAISVKTAHYWHEQYRPFKDDAERDAVLRDLLLNKSAFTHSWAPELLEKFNANPDLFKIKYRYNDSTSVEITSINRRVTSLRLFINPSEAPFHESRHKRQLISDIHDYAFTLGHEGRHVAQKDSHVTFRSRYLERDADEYGIRSIFESTVSTKDKFDALRIGSQQFVEACKKHHQWKNGSLSCQHSYSEHPSCSSRIAQIEQAISGHIVPLLKIEQASETMRFAWDPTAS